MLAPYALYHTFRLSIVLPKPRGQAQRCDTKPIFRIPGGNQVAGWIRSPMLRQEIQRDAWDQNTFQSTSASMQARVSRYSRSSSSWTSAPRRELRGEGRECLRRSRSTAKAAKATSLRRSPTVCVTASGCAGSAGAPGVSGRSTARKIQSSARQRDNIFDRLASRTALIHSR